MLNASAITEEKLQPSNLRIWIELNRTELKTKNMRTKPNLLCLDRIQTPTALGIEELSAS